MNYLIVVGQKNRPKKIDRYSQSAYNRAALIREDFMMMTGIEGVTTVCCILTADRNLNPCCTASGALNIFSFITKGHLDWDTTAFWTGAALATSAYLVYKLGQMEPVKQCLRNTQTVAAQIFNQQRELRVD